MSEGNNEYTRQFVLGRKIAPEDFNNGLGHDTELGVQGKIREILHAMQSAIRLEGLVPSGMYNDVGVTAGVILTKNVAGLSRVVDVAAATGLNITATTDCIVASADGTCSVKAKTSVLSTDVIIAIRAADDTLVDMRNPQTEDDILTKNVDILGIAGAVTMRSSLEVKGTLNVEGITTAEGNLIAQALTQIYKLGVDTAGLRTIVVKNGDVLADAITALGGIGTIILLPGAYAGTGTVSNAINIIGVGIKAAIITGNVTLNGNGSMINGCGIVGVVTISGTDCIVRDCEITGYVSVNGADSIVDNCTITYSASVGGTWLIDGSSAQAVIVKYCHLDGTELTGGIKGSHNSLTLSNFIYNVMGNAVYVNGDYSIVTGNFIYNCKHTSSTPTYLGCIYVVNATNNCIIANNIITAFSTDEQHAYAITVSDSIGVAVTGNNVSAVVAVGTGKNAVGIVLSGTISYCSVSGNTVYGVTAGSGGTPKGIDLTGAATNMTAVGNTSNVSCSWGSATAAANYSP